MQPSQEQLRSFIKIHLETNGLHLLDDDSIVDETGAVVAHFLGVDLTKEGLYYRIKSMVPMNYVSIQGTIEC